MTRIGFNDCAIARATGIPRRTIRDWRVGKSRPRDTKCLGHDFGALNTDAYGYLLGLYLGDGCLSERPRSVFSACDLVGVHTTRPSWKRVAVYRKAAVARLDEFVGPKS